MAIIPPALSPVSKVLDNVLPDRYLVLMQENLIRSGMYVKASDLITLMLMGGIIFGVLGTGFIRCDWNQSNIRIDSWICNPNCHCFRLVILFNGTSESIP